MKTAPDEDTVFTEDEDTDEVAKENISTELEPELEMHWTSDTVVYFGEKTRSICLDKEINSEVATALCSQIRQLAKISEEPITIYINTAGGNLGDALSIYDLLKTIPNNIITIVNGLCASSGLLILSAGDLRLSTKHSKFFFHQPSIFPGIIDSKENVDYLLILYNEAKKENDKILKSTMNISKDKWKKYFGKRSHAWFNAETALSLNLIHHILKYKTKPELVLPKDFNG